MLNEGSLVQTAVRADVQLDIASHYVRVTNFTPRVKFVLLEYCKQLAQYGLMKTRHGRFQKVMIRVFVAVTRDRSVFHFHRNELNNLLEYLKYNGVPEARWSVLNIQPNPGDDIELDYIDNRTAREDQVPLIEYMVDSRIIKLASIDPGRGKTFVALSAISKLKKRVFICIKAMYIEKWIGDIEAAFKCKKGDIVVIRGGAALKNLMQLAANDELTAKFVICSNMTYFNFIKEYEVFKDDVLDMGYACLPHQFYELCGFGIRLIDEVHQDIHLNYRQDLFTNCQKSISLSGTLEGDDPFINGRTEVMFPKNQRIDNGERVVFTAAVGLEYRLNPVHRLKWQNKARGSYSHIVFEQSILRNKQSLQKYKMMVADLVAKTYRQERQEGQKILIYADFVDMVTELADYLRLRNPDLKVERYVAEDDFEDMLQADIIVSTLKSLGTAQDIPGLLHVIMTSSLGSKQGNLQAMGRLRDTVIKQWPGSKPIFYYLVCTDIPKHLEYHHRKVETFEGRVTGHKLLATEYVI